MAKGKFPPAKAAAKGKSAKGGAALIIGLRPKGDMPMPGMKGMKGGSKGKKGAC